MPRRFPYPAAGRSATALLLAGWLLILLLATVGVGPRPALAEPGSVRPTAGYRWPLDGSPPVLRRFAAPASPWGAGHRGVDLGAVPGAIVRAAGPGVVHFAGLIAGSGVVSVAHTDGLLTTYEPVRPLVRVGQRVATGDPIGVLVAGHPRCPSAACLHWGLRRGRAYLDPLALLGLGRVRLLPLDGP